MAKTDLNDKLGRKIKKMEKKLKKIKKMEKKLKKIKKMEKKLKKIKKAEKKLKKLKASVAKMREEMTQRANSAENAYKAIVDIRETVHQLTSAAESSNAKLGELISAWLPQDDDD